MNAITFFDAGGRLTVERMANRATIDGRFVRMPCSAADVLELLARHGGTPVPIARIRRQLWNEVNRRDEPPDPRKSIQHLVWRLRDALRDTAASIETCYGDGYRLHLQPNHEGRHGR